MLRNIVVIGAAAAGLAAAETLREEGYAGRIVMVGDEVHPAYDRPPLSKQLLLGTRAPCEVALRSEDALGAMNIELRRGVSATALDLGASRVALDTGEELGFDGLIIATGLRARRLPRQPALAGVHTLRTLDDAMAIRRGLTPGGRVLVVGAGFLGCEIAATARQLGHEVTLLDPCGLPMARQLGPVVAASVLRLQRTHGVDVRCGTSLQSFISKNGAVTGARLSDASVVPAQLVVVAIGAVPAIDWLLSSGLTLDDGVRCDEYCRAADRVYAAGDVANWLHRGLGRRMRLEHRMNATEQGMAAARNLLGAAVPFEPVPYFWTDLYDVKIQSFGSIGPGQAMTVLSGEPGQSGFVAAWSSPATGKVEAVLGWSAPRELRRARALIGQPLPPQNIASASAAIPASSSPASG